VFPVPPLEPSTWMLMPLTLDWPPFEVAPTIVSCFGPGRNAPVVAAGTWMTIVSGVLAEPGVQLTTPPFALVSVVTSPVRASVRLTCPPVTPVGPAGPMKSPWIVIRRAVPVLPASTYGRETWSSSGVVEAVSTSVPVIEKSQPVPEIGSTGVSSCVVRPGQASVGVVAVSRFGLNVGLGLAFVPGSSTTTRYMPGQGPCGIGQLNVSVDGTMASYEPSAPVRTVFSSRHLFGSYGVLIFGVGQFVPPPAQTVSTRA